jgi:hypothetical protein
MRAAALFLGRGNLNSNLRTKLFARARDEAFLNQGTSQANAFTFALRVLMMCFWVQQRKGQAWSPGVLPPQSPWPGLCKAGRTPADPTRHDLLR